MNEIYTQPGVMTAPGRYGSLLAELPRDIAALVRVGHGLLIHEHIARAYDVTITDDRRDSVHIRPIERILDRLRAEDDSPLATVRKPQQRLPGNCRHFTVLAVAIMRSQGIAARARCGFGDYFGSGWFEDHWVCEYWDATGERWTLVDAQIDDVQQAIFRPDFNLLDVPRDRFLVAGTAWQRCRSGLTDPAKFGLSLLNEGGLWWVAANLVRDVAALCNMEMLPWDVWGAMPAPTDRFDEDRLAYFDRLAALTVNPDLNLSDLTEWYERDDRIRVPSTVHNAVLHRDEPVPPAVTCCP